MRTSTPSSTFDPHGAARIPYLDWLRLVAVVGVFVFHTTRPYQTVGSDWHVVSDEKSWTLTVVAALLAQWLPTTFFMVAGASTYFALSRRSNVRFIRERVARLLVPFVVGAVTLTPVQLYLDRLHRGADVQPDSAFVADAWATIIGQSDIVGPRFFVETGLHLWFLAFLFFSAVFSVPFVRHLRNARLAWAGRLANWRFGLLLGAIPLTVSRFVLPVAGPGRYDWADFVFLLLFFLFGALLFSDSRLLSSLRRDRWYLLAVAVITDVAAGALFLFGVLPSAFTQSGGLAPLGVWALFSVLTLSWSLVALEAARTLLDRESSWLHRWGGAAIGFFVLHQPVVIAVAFFLVESDLALYPQYAVLTGASFVATAVLAGLIWLVPGLRNAFGMKVSHPKLSGGG